MKFMNWQKFRRLLFFMVCITGFLQAQQLAFPTAEGYGKITKGGRGGKVYEVTTLKGTGPGSFGEAIKASGPRTVVFRVAGNIVGDFIITNSHITIAGQTAPGDGICIKGFLGFLADEIIIRYVRVRSNTNEDAFGGYGKNIIIDHVSASWSSDEVMSIYRGTNVTIQYCLVSEAAGNGHRFGGIWGNIYGTYHHNCIAHCDNRTPRWAGKQNEFNDYRNNIIYNWGYGGCYGGLGADKINMVANYYKPGPATANRSRIAAPNGGNWHVSGNVVIGSDEVTKDNWKGLESSAYKRMDEPWDAMPIRQESPEEAYNTFLEHGGCSFPVRDAVDTRIIEEIRTGTATRGNKGLITTPSDAGSWPELKSAPAPADKDHDGMPDEWETKNGLNPDDASDGSKTGKDGYTNLENYINGLVDKGTASVIGRDTRNRNVFESHLLRFTPSLRQIELVTRSRSKIRLDIFDIMGHHQATLLNEIKEPGVYQVAMSGLNLTPGSYICKLTTPVVSVSKSIYLHDR